ncbi:MAG: preprotein translocase subunit SecE [Synechococcaceae cyanobacterium]
MAQITPSTSSQSEPERPVGPVVVGGDEGPTPDPLASEEQQGGFARETLAELRRVVWPSRQQLFSESIAVILMVSLSAAAIAAVDRFFGWVASQVFR